MKLDYTYYNPNTSYIDYISNTTTGLMSRRILGSTYTSGDCVIRAITKATDLDYRTVAASIAYRRANHDDTMLRNHFAGSKRVHKGDHYVDVVHGNTKAAYLPYLHNLGFATSFINNNRVNSTKYLLDSSLWGTYGDPKDKVDFDFPSKSNYKRLDLFHKATMNDLDRLGVSDPTGRPFVYHIKGHLATVVDNVVYDLGDSTRMTGTYGVSFMDDDAWDKHTSFDWS